MSEEHLKDVAALLLYLIVGFLNYGNVIPWQPNALGVGISRKYAGQGLAKGAVTEFINRRVEFNIGEINAYCNRNNLAAIHIMQSVGFIQDTSFMDRLDQNALRFYLS